MLANWPGWKYEYILEKKCCKMLKSYRLFLNHNKDRYDFFLSCIKTTVNRREKFLCQQAKNNQYFPGFFISNSNGNHLWFVLDCFFFGVLIPFCVWFLSKRSFFSGWWWKQSCSIFVVQETWKRKLKWWKTKSFGGRRCMEDLFECMVKSFLKMLLDVISALFFF